MAITGINVKEQPLELLADLTPADDWVLVSSEAPDQLKRIRLRELVRYDFGVSCSDEESPLDTGVAKVLYLPKVYHVEALFGSLNQPAIGLDVEISFSVGGANLLDGVLAIPIAESTSLAPVDFATDMQDIPAATRIEIEITQVGFGIAGSGLTVWFLGWWLE